jgi:hypothetical protein
MDFRKAQGREIARLGGISKRGDVWLVPSQSRPGVKYKVTIDDDKQTCNCPDCKTNGGPCKHIHAATIYKTEYPRTELIDPPLPIKKQAKKKKLQDWPNYNRSQTQQKPLFMRLLAGFCRSVDDDEPKATGRPRIPRRDTTFLACYKVFEGFSARRFDSDVGFAYRSGFVSCEPHWNSVLNAMKSPNITQILLDLVDQTSAPLRDFERVFAADSSGFGNSRFDRWIDIKDPANRKKRHTWTKVHLMCGVSTHIVTAVVIKDKDASDPPQLPSLVKMTAKNFQMSEVCADRAYASIENYDVIGEHGAIPYIDFKSNHTGKGLSRTGEMIRGTALWQRMFHMFKMHADEFYVHYHQRSNVESVFSMIKAKFDDVVRSKSETAMLNEVLCKIVCHNICVLISAMFELGLDLDDFLTPKVRRPNLQLIQGDIQ